MSPKSCPKHPDSESMVPCLGCGRDFCSICDPIRGAGQYCPTCYENSLAHISKKKPVPILGRLRDLRGKRKAGGSQKPEVTERGGETVQRKKQFAGLGGVRAGAMGKRSVGTAAGRPEGVLGGAKRVAPSISGWMRALPGRVIPRTMAFTREHFPLAIVDTRRGEGMPPLASAWYKLLPVVLGGAAAWTVIVAETHRRVGLHTWIIAAIVAVCVVWSLGPRFDLPTAVVTMMLTLLALAMGEVLVHLLYSSKVIKTLDLGIPQSASAYYRDFLYKVLVHRMLLSALIAFLIGLWPLPKRIGWRGFKRTEEG